MNKCYQFAIAANMLLLLPMALVGQTRIVSNPITTTSVASLSSVLKKYSLFEINTAALVQEVKLHGKDNIDFILDLPGYAEFPLSITENDILSSDYKLIAGTLEGNQIFPKTDCITYAGTLINESNSHVSLTITSQLIYGIIEGKGKQFFIEPLRYLEKQAADNIFVVYETVDVVPRAGNGCGVTEVAKQIQNLSREHSSAKMSGTATGTCKMVEVAIASDDSMFYRYTTVAAVQNHNIAVMNTVVGIYSNAQIGTQYLEFKITGQYVSTTPASNPVTPAYTGFDASILLTNFGNWAQAGNFGVTYDLGQFWTTKDIATETFTGSGVYNYGVIGLAWVGSICSAYRYQVIEDNLPLSGYGQALTVAHETGHDFGASHDGSPGYIMYPTINTAVTGFSSTSITAMNTYINSGITCLSACNATLPVAQFSASASGICTGNSITFTDHSVGEVTNILWSFPGGSPSSSASASQVVSYSTPGYKTITLTSTNVVGPSSITQTVFVGNALAAACKTNIASNSETPLLCSVFLGNIQHVTNPLTLGGTYLNHSCTDNTVLQPGTTYNMTTNLGFLQLPTYNISNKVQVFIDYNNNGSFLDANEAVFSSSACHQNNYQFPITTIASVPISDTWLRLRVIGLACSLSNTDGCSIPSNSQTEDYAVYFPSALALPLIKFDGQYANGENELNWQTAETDYRSFEVERSIGEQSLDFISIGKVKASLFQARPFQQIEGRLILRNFIRISFFMTG